MDPSLTATCSGDPRFSIGESNGGIENSKRLRLAVKREGKTAT
jgi:hypothetical protein